jgi:hypothetical protein
LYVLLFGQSESLASRYGSHGCAVGFTHVVLDP